MIRNKNIKTGIIEVESAENLEQLREGILTVFKEIDRELDWLNQNLGEVYEPKFRRSIK